MMRKRAVLVIAALLGFYSVSLGLEIESFDGNGQLIFNQVTNAGAYRVEWASSPDGPWTNTWGNLGNMLAPAEHSVTCSVPMFYRVVAEMGIPMVEIPGGTNSGVNPLGPGESYSDSSYRENYTLTVDTFHMDTTEVTKGQWDVVYNWATASGYVFENPGESWGDDSHPVRSINWYDAAKWCNARSEKEGLTPCYTISNTVYRVGRVDKPDCDLTADGYRLPTVEEYEYAARGGLVGQRFPWGDTITHDDAVYNSTTNYSYDVSSTRGDHPDYSRTAPVASLAPNGYGLYDLAGNVIEWCSDIGYYTDLQHRLYGGAYDLDASYQRCGKISWAMSQTAGFNHGFRCVQIRP